MRNSKTNSIIMPPINLRELKKNANPRNTEKIMTPTPITHIQELNPKSTQWKHKLLSCHKYMPC